jgi:hypothetical protein
LHELPKAGVLAVTRWGEGGASHQRGLHPIYNPRRGDCGCNPVRALHNYPHPSEGFVEAARRGLCIIPHPGEGLWKQPGEGSAKFHTPARGLWKHPGEGSAQPGEGSARTVHEACHGRECLVCHFGSRILVTGFRPAVAGLSQAWGFSPQAGGGNPLRATGRRAREVPSSSRKARTLDFPDRGSSGVGGGSALRSVPSVLGPPGTLQGDTHSPPGRRAEASGLSPGRRYRRSGRLGWENRPGLLGAWHPQRSRTTEKRNMKQIDSPKHQTIVL